MKLFFLKKYYFYPGTPFWSWRGSAATARRRGSATRRTESWTSRSTSGFRASTGTGSLTVASPRPCCPQSWVWVTRATLIRYFLKKTSFLLFFLDIFSNNIFNVRHLSSFPATRAFLLMRTLAGTKSSEKEERRYQRPVLVLAGQRRSVVCIVNLTGRGKLIKTTFVNLTFYYLWLWYSMCHLD